MKSFVSYPLELEKKLYPDNDNHPLSLIAHYELFKKVSRVDGAIVISGIAAQHEFARFALFKSLIPVKASQKLVVFEKLARNLVFETEPGVAKQLQYRFRNSIDVSSLQEELRTKGMEDAVDFVNGNIEDAIPGYLIENPDLKIAYLQIDLDDYDAALTTLQFFYPRLAPGGIVVFDNYYKADDDYRAICDYFAYSRVEICNFSIHQGPHYIIRS